MKNVIKWVKQFQGYETLIDGFRISRVKLQNGGHLYWVHWFEHPDWSAPHSKMSDKMYSLFAARKLIRQLKQSPEIYYSNLRLPDTNRLMNVFHKTRGA